MMSGLFIPELGHLAMILALCFAIVQASVPLLGAWRGDKLWMSLAQPAAWGQFAFLLFAFGCLTYAFMTDDFSVRYVASNSNSALPWYYKFSAVWGAHEGSLLLWALILGGWTFAVSVFSRQLPQVMLARVLAIMGMISVGFLLFLILTSNPFARLLPQMPANGNDLNPLLQDIGLIVHPPMLYMGYVGFSVAFAFAIAALLGGRLDAAWARWSRCLDAACVRPYQRAGLYWPWQGQTHYSFADADLQAGLGLVVGLGCAPDFHADSAVSVLRPDRPRQCHQQS